MMGFAFVRYAWKIESVASMSDDEAIAAISPTCSTTSMVT
jgi:hypothetical protein